MFVFSPPVRGRKYKHSFATALLVCTSGPDVARGATVSHLSMPEQYQPAWGFRAIASVSTASTPDGPQISGLTSNASSTSPSSSISTENATIAPAIAAVSHGWLPRVPASTCAKRSPETDDAAAVRVSGGSATDRSGKS